MHHFLEAVTNTRGDALIGYYVKIFSGAGVQQSLYADSSLTPIVSVSGVADTCLIDFDGMADFWIAPGSYTFVTYATNGTTEVKRRTNVPMGDTGNPLIDSIGGLTFAADNYIYGTAANTAAAGTITTFGRSLVDDANAAAARTTLGATTVGSNVFTLTNPSAITFPRFNADNTVDALSAAAFRTAIGAGVGGGDLVSTNNLSDITTPAAAATNLGLGTGNSPQFTGVNIGHASDTTITRTGAGDIAVEGNAIYRAGGTDVALADGGTGASLADPNADRVLFWDDSAGALTWLTMGTNLTITGTTLDATGGASGAAWQLQWGPLVNEPPSSNFATLDTRNGHPTLDFDTTTQETAIFTGVLPADYSGAGIVVSVFCALTSATSGTVGWDVSIERIDASSLDIDADSFATVQTITAATAPGTSGQILKQSVSISNGANMDSLAAGELFRIRIRRDVANDTATGDAELLRVMMVSQ